MKFNQICKQLFITEEDEVGSIEKKVAAPQDFNDVQPLPSSAAQQNVAAAEQNAQAGATIQQQVEKLEKFVEFLNGTEGESLQIFLNKLDVPKTSFEGIKDNGQLKSAILSTVKSAYDIIAVLNQYINVAKA